MTRVNIDRTFVIAEAQKVHPSRRFGFYRWMLKIAKAQ